MSRHDEAGPWTWRTWAHAVGGAVAGSALGLGLAAALERWFL